MTPVINSFVPADSFTGAYNKRMEQNRFKADSEAAHIRQADQKSVKDLYGEDVRIEITAESKAFLAGVSERKAAQKLAMETAQAEASEQGTNVFAGTGDFRQQYLVLSENLYNNGFYNNLSDDKVQELEGMLQEITAGMEQINSERLNPLSDVQMSHEAARLELISSTNALRQFAKNYLSDETRDSFLNIVNQYERYNSAKVAVYKSVYDLRDESMSALPTPNTVASSAVGQLGYADFTASKKIGSVTHTKEEEQKNGQEYQALFDKLISRQEDIASIFKQLNSAFLNYASGGSTDKNVLALLNSRNHLAISGMESYWTKLLLPYNI